MDQINIENKQNENEDKKLKRKEYLKQYQKEYREKNKEKINNYESKKYNEKHNERVKKHVKKNGQILKLIKESFKLNLLTINDEEKFNQLKTLLK
jgi:hypothetical protein